MLSMSVQPSIKGTLPCPFSIASKQTCFSTSNPSVYLKQKSFSLHSLSNPDLKTKSRIRRFRSLSAAATAELDAPETITETKPSAPKLARESEFLMPTKKPVPKPKLVLKFIWMEKNIGIGLDQSIPKRGTVPLSPYFFWPRKDAWEELKTTLEKKPWVSQKKMIILLNQATDIINLWQQSGGNLSQG